MTISIISTQTHWAERHRPCEIFLSGVGALKNKVSLLVNSWFLFLPLSLFNVGTGAFFFYFGWWL